MVSIPTLRAIATITTIAFINTLAIIQTRIWNAWIAVVRKLAIHSDPIITKTLTAISSGSIDALAIIFARV